MRCVSIWNPYATLIANGHKLFETRGYAAPRSLIGQTIGIASTKTIKPEQRAAFSDPDFQDAYEGTGLGDFDTLYNGYLLGTVTLHSCEPITQELVDDITSEELAFGWWEEGRYAWRLRHARAFKYPIPVRGAQGIWIWKGNDGQTAIRQNEVQSGTRQEGKAHLRLVHNAA